ncbi:XRE family transcriptional regulator [Nodularia spumigena]|uniref:XRE family transcriptional regulator n=1 Tax=Nodularia spumigena TaxID=70799 RepID=UPI0030DA1AB5
MKSNKDKFQNNFKDDKSYTNWIHHIEEFFSKNDLDINWIENFEIFCLRYNLNIKHLKAILNDPKVIPMIRGKSFEFTAKDYVSTILSEKYYVTNPRLNAQTGLNDIDVSIINQSNGKKYSVECKLAKKGSFRLNRGKNPYIEVKCMRSRTLGENAALQRSKLTGIPFEALMVRNDQYIAKDLDLVITSIANAFFQTDTDGLFYWFPPPEAQLFLEKLGISNQNDAFSKMYVAKSKHLAANQINQVKCTRQKCKDLNCSFIPNYPKIYFDNFTGQPLDPWVSMDNIESLLD